MGAAGSTLHAMSPKAGDNEDNVHFYDAFLKMKLDKMSDDEIYAALKKKYAHGRSPKTGRAMQKDSLQLVALMHFSQTLETNRVVFEKNKLMADEIARSHSCDIMCPELDVASPVRERVPLQSNKTPKKGVQLTVDILVEDTDAIIAPPVKVMAAKPSRRPQLTVCIDSEHEDDDMGAQAAQQQLGDGGDGEPVRTPRVDGRISPSGAVHVGKFAIHERGLHKEVTQREGAAREPHAFLTAGKSDFVEVGFLGSGATSSIIEALHIPTLTLVALKMLPAKDSSDLQCISSELSVLYKNLAELRLIDVRLDEEENSDDDERREGGQHEGGQQMRPRPCQQVLALYDGEPTRLPALVTPLQSWFCLHCTDVCMLVCKAFLDSKNGMVNLVVEYMDGGSLQDLVDRGGCQDERVLADIAHQVPECALYSTHMSHAN